MDEARGTKAVVDDDGRLFTLKELAEYLSCSPTYAANLIADGTVPSFKIGSLRRVRKRDVDELIQSRLAAKE